MANSPFIYGPNGATSLVPGGVTLPASTSGTLQIQPAATTTSYAVEMPPAQGAAASTLVNDGAGNLSWTQLATTQNVYQSIYNTTSSTTYPPGENVVKYTSVVLDSTGAYNSSTGVFTVPVNGTYLVNANMADLTDERIFMSIFKNGVEYARGESAGSITPAIGAVSPSVSASVPCVVGDVLSIYVYVSTSSTGSAASNVETMSIVLLNPTAPGILVVPPSPTRTVLTSGSGTYTTPANVTYIRVRMVGGGAGGSGATTTAGQGAGGNGGTTTFGPFTANGGTGADASSLSNGGTVSVSGGTIIQALTGATGGGSGFDVATTGIYVTAGMGGVSPFGGAGAGGSPAGSGSYATANTGSGGGGGSYNGSAPTYAGAGGGAGGYIEAYIASPASTYSYTIGSGGASGGGYGAGTANGGGGGSGIVIVEEFYPAATAATTATVSPITTVTTSTATLTVANNYVIVNYPSGTCNITIPGAATAGLVFNIKTVTTKNVIVTPTSGTVDGASTLTISGKYTSANIVSDGTNYWVV